MPIKINLAKAATLATLALTAYAQAPKKPAASAAAKKAAPKAATKPAAQSMTDDQKTIYALGASMARSISHVNWSPAELDVLKRGLTESLTSKPAIDVAASVPNIGPLIQTRQKTYLEHAAAEPGAVKTPSGLIYKELHAGTGASPKSTDTVKVNYRGAFISGVEFDSSYSRHEPTEFPLDHVIPCWTEGVQKMKPGGKAQLVCPAEIAYGERGQPGAIPGGATLVFEIELLEVKSK